MKGKTKHYERKAQALMLVVSSHPAVLVISYVIHNQGFTSVASVFASAPDHISTEEEQVFSC